MAKTFFFMKTCLIFSPDLTALAFSLIIQLNNNIFSFKNLKSNRYILGLRSKGFFCFCLGGEGRCGRIEEGSGIQIVQEDTELRNTGKYFFPPDLLQTP